MAEFRWILLGLGLLLIAGIWWWGGRRSAQAPGNAELRETAAKEPQRQEAAARATESAPDMGEPIYSREWEKSPFEPLSIRTSDLEDVRILDESMMLAAEPRLNEPHIPDDADTVPNADTGPVMPPLLTKVVSAPAKLAVKSTAEPRKKTNSDKQKIVTMRVCAIDEARWSGSALLSAFESHGLAFGRYQVFHRRHIDGRSLFSVASLVEPGTFDVAQMREQQFKGVTLFAVLPGPLDPLFTIDEMLAAARGLASELPGTLQDAKGAVLSAQRMAALRDDIAQFQASLSLN